VAGIEVLERDGLACIRVRVSPGARKARILGEHDGALKLAVAEPPESGRANEGVIRLLADVLGLAARQIEIISGHRSREKQVAISGLAPDDVAAALERASRA
jgi:uncharacterized protein